VAGLRLATLLALASQAATPRSLPLGQFYR
jgi:hypothetical protein